MPDFVHLHCHTHYSLLDGASRIPALMDKAVADGQKGIAITDHGNMFGAFEFVSEAKKNEIWSICNRGRCTAEAGSPKQDC